MALLASMTILIASITLGLVGLSGSAYQAPGAERVKLCHEVRRPTNV